MEQIKEQFKKVIEYSQKFTPDIEDIFDDWKENKKWFIEKFGGLIYEYPEIVQFELDAAAKEERVKALEEFFIAEGYYDLSRFIIREKDGFFDNKVIEEYVTPDGIIIPKNMKLLKAFKYFIKGNPQKLNDFQMKASVIIQENKVSGKLCLSAHPLDYLSSSENTYNWRSCHSLDGAYRAGNLSYMTDDCTFICYLKSEEDVKLPHFPEDVLWNSKKWRMLIHMSQERTLMFAGRQYPFQSTAVFDILHKICENLFKRHWTKWDNHYYTDDCLGDLPIHFHKRYLPLGQPQDLDSIITDYSKNNLHYNDLLYSHCYTKPYYSCAYRSDCYSAYLQVDKSNIKVGHDVYCLHCGEHPIETASDTMMCFDCELEYGTEENETFGYCDCCGERIFLDSAYYIETNSKTYCSTCYHSEIACCDYCDREFEIEELDSNEYGELICEDCRIALEEEKKEDAE